MRKLLLFYCPARFLLFEHSPSIVNPAPIITPAVKLSRRKLEAWSFSSLLCRGADAKYGFRQDDNFYYLSGVTEPGVALVIAPATEAKENVPARAYTEILFLPPHNLRLEKFTGPKLGAENPDAPKITGFDRVEEMAKLPEEVFKILGNGRPVVYTDVASHGETSASAEPLTFLRRTNAFLILQDVKPALDSLRTIKDAGEIALLQ